MIELATKAENYAAEKTSEVMTKAIAQAYADGYRDGYKDREGEIPVDLRDNKTEYVDLGLPSGTLWATDYEREEGEIVYAPHGKASLYNIPTLEQWEELCENCEWELGTDFHLHFDEARCVGPNGAVLRFGRTGLQEVCQMSDTRDVFFWIKDEKESNNKDAVQMWKVAPNCYKLGKSVKEFFSGYKLPIRLVRTK